MLKWLLKQTGWEGMDWINVVQDRQLVSPCEHGNAPSVSTKFGKIFG
jgi:hypothetical protein